MKHRLTSFYHRKLKKIEHVLNEIFEIESGPHNFERISAKFNLIK